MQEIGLMVSGYPQEIKNIIHMNIAAISVIGPVDEFLWFIIKKIYGFCIY
jgi:hypothetical protein